MPQPQQKLGKYEIRRELGKGAMGVVYLAYDPVLEREVALKVMASTIVSDKDLKERFEREAKAVARLQHPHIVTVYDLGYDDQGSPFIAMELLKGTDLEAMLRKNPPSFDEKLKIIMQVCRGLSHAHKNGIVHRDIKPANVFVTESGDIKIMDFGVARWMQSSQTQTGAILGTADYMSPEQIRGHRVDGRSDIFSVGVILYRLLTRKKPFKGENIQSVFFKILNSDPPELLLADGTQIPELQAIVDRAMAKDAAERYPTADTMAQDLEQFLHKYHGAVSEDTIFDTAFDPGSAVEHDTSGRTRRPTFRRAGTGSQRLTPTSAGSVSRTYRPTGVPAAPPTGAGVAPVGTVPGVRPTAVVPPTRFVRRRPMPPARRRTPWVLMTVIVVALAGAAGGAYWYATSQPQEATPTTDLQSRFAFAEEAFQKGQLSQAFDQVENILTISPENQRALELKEKILKALERKKRPTPAPPPPPTRSASSSPSPAEQQAQAILADASIALASGDVEAARGLIAQGEQLTPSDPKWAQLKHQLREKQRELQQQSEQQKKEQAVNSLLKRAAELIEAEEFDQAIDAYERVLEIDPSNVTAASGKVSVRNMKQMALERQRQADMQRRAAMTTRTIRQSKTRYIEAPGKRGTPKGFETSGGVKVKRATTAAEFPCDLIIELNPPNAQPGQPYELIVRLLNEGNRMIQVKFLELVSTYGDMVMGKGQRIEPQVRRVGARGTVVLHQVSGRWKEEQDKGSITATVTLVGDAKLTKTIQW